MSHESVLSAGSLDATRRSRPLPVLRVAVGAISRFSLGFRIPSAPDISLEALDASAGGRPGRAKLTARIVSNTKEKTKHGRGKRGGGGEETTELQRTTHDVLHIFVFFVR